MPHALRANRTPPQIIDLHFENREGKVRITGPDNHILIQPVEAAVEACRAYSVQIQFKAQFDALLEKLGQWLDSHAQHVADAYLTAQDSGLLFLVVTKNKHYDEVVETALTEFDLEMAQDTDFDLIHLGVHAIPNATKEVIDSFVSRKFAFRFIPDGNNS